MMASSRKEADALISLLLSKGADPNATNRASQTALHFAASKSALDVARALIQAKASTRTKDKRGQLPLHRAAAVGNVPMIRLLLENKSPLNASDVDGMTALHHAMAEGHGDAALVFLREGAESGKKDGEERLAIDCAPDVKVRQFVLDSAEREGIDVVTS
ncbi:putative proteasome regulatory particle subunit [Microthyrium microscopicum]|uniref:Putative proteasome regulatory particle subunit n=1 Tax=Microthyrium microscopicum TaxID=703497 RepID=A0A6A6U7J8_9PEZI|nr:putative proteasome regulatory particle subunit [Microthyrium microscopicum]